MSEISEMPEIRPLGDVAPGFVAMAHRIVWCSAATVDARGRPRSRILHPIWDWDGESLRGWIATQATATKRAHLAASPFVSLSYWAPDQDTCLAECRADWAFDDATRTEIWERFRTAPPPVGYDPAIIPGWTAPTCDAFSVLTLAPWRLRVFPGTVLLAGRGEVLTWKAA